ncbi:hypothetical protein ACM915_002372, partial [Cronobacter turicensis]
PHGPIFFKPEKTIPLPSVYFNWRVRGAYPPYKIFSSLRLSIITRKKKPPRMGRLFLLPVIRS